MPRSFDDIRRRFASLQAALLAGLLCAVVPATAADTPSESAPARPRIGLALGGGGARGLAHIGVLKVLEELRVPVDYIAGTSSGAIIGGLYAAGLSPQEIEDRIVAIDWDDILSDRLARRDLSYRRKQNDRDYLFPMEIGVRGFRLIFPRGLIAGQKIGFFLRSATLGVAGVTDFNRLPIPYRAVATDLETGAPVALARGDLAEAMQASMAIPGIFSPVEIGGRLLADGGMSENVPVEAVRAMGADIIIAVNLSAPLLTREQLESVVDVSDQTLSFLSQKTNQQQLTQLRGDDVLITPELNDVGASQFERANEIIASGLYAAGIQELLLRQISVSERSYDAYLRRQRREDQPRVRLDAIVVDQPARVDRQIITRRLNTAAGQDLDVETLRGDMARIFDLGDFERVDFRVEHRGELNELHVDVQEKSWGPNYLRFGLNLIDDFEGESRFNILANYTRTWINRLGGEWKNDFSIGNTRKVFTELYQPMDPFSVWFLAPHAQYVQDTFDVYDGEHRVAEYKRKRWEAGIDTGLQLGKHGEVRVGMVRERVDSEPRIGAQELPEYNVRQGAWTGSVVYDQIDNVYFPRRGFLAGSRLFAARGYLGADTVYEKLDVNWLTAFTYKTHTMYGGFELGTNLDDKLPLYDTFTLGGFQRLSGFSSGQLSGQHLAFGRLVYFERVGRLPKAAGGGVYVGASLEMGNVWDDEDAADLVDWHKAYSLFASAETTLGPLYFAYGQSDGGNYAFYLFLGRTF